jgi:hypothetical protein
MCGRNLRGCSNPGAIRGDAANQIRINRHTTADAPLTWRLAPATLAFGSRPTGRCRGVPAVDPA